MQRKTCRKEGNTIRCECGGLVSAAASLHPPIDIGVGFKRGDKRPRVEARYNYKKVVGYRGTCMKCRFIGDFALNR